MLKCDCNFSFTSNRPTIDSVNFGNTATSGTLFCFRYILFSSFLLKTMFKVVLAVLAVLALGSFESFSVVNIRLLSNL